MDKVVYICTGSCKAEVSQEDYDKGLTKCGADTCNMHNHPFKKVFKCAQCGAYYEEAGTHSH